MAVDSYTQMKHDLLVIKVMLAVEMVLVVACFVMVLRLPT